MKVKLNVFLSSQEFIVINDITPIIDLNLYMRKDQLYKDVIKKQNIRKLISLTSKEQKEEINKIKATPMEKKYIFNPGLIYEFSIYVDDNKTDEEKYEIIRCFIDNNKKALNGKQIIVEKSLLISDNRKIESLLNNLYGYNNVYVTLDGEDNLIHLSKLKRIVNKIDALVSKVNGVTSPFEKAMYAYDLVRDRTYKKSTSKDLSVSRSLSHVLFEDEIVCLGFANIYNCVLQKLGIKSEVCYLESATYSKPGHVRNIMYIKDNKYGIEGVYFSDPTFDSKRNDNYFLYSYKYFCKPYDFFKEEDYINEYEWLFDDFEELFNKYIESGLSSFEITDLKMLSHYLSLLNKLAIFIDNKGIVKFPNPGITKDEFNKKIEKYRSLFNASISAEKFLKALEIVRKQEYLSNPQKYPYGVSSFGEIFCHSNFKFDYMTKEEKLLSAIFDERREISSPSKKFCSYVDDTGFAKESEEIRLVNVLKNLISKKKGKY